jgi:putative protease
MMELLSPAGSPEAVVAAVQSGADAIYLGCGSFNARRNAANFSEEELKTAVEYCHLRGTKVYLTLNTLLYDKELEEASQLVRYADQVGVDALLVQDLGVLRMAKATAPQLEIHASTQMTLHDLEGVRFAADLGISRAVLSRELSKDQIAEICAKSPIEIEVFVHGALCMCYSGQCFFSSVIGGRSGNRGLCAQPCRLKYGWNGKAERELLSLKDMSLANYLQELQEMGVACAKIEGRMKRPEYVAVVTKIYSAALKEGRTPTQEELAQLQAAFSRQGFTDGYYRDKTGPAMFGVRKDNEIDPTPMFQKAKAEYSRGEHPKVELSLHAQVKADAPVTVTAEDGEGHSVTVEGLVPEPAKNRAITSEQVSAQLAKTGGTPFLAHADAQVEEGLSLPLSALNGLRRQVVEELSKQRTTPPQHIQKPWNLEKPVRGEKVSPAVAVSVENWGQISGELLDLQPSRVEISLEMAQNVEKLRTLTSRCPVVIVLPRVIWNREIGAVEKILTAAREVGGTQCLSSTWGSLALAQRLGFQVRGDFGLGVCNSETVRGLRELGLVSATASFEQRLPRIRDLSHELPLELLAYGRLPLMVMENCIIANRTGGKCKKACETGKNLLTDRKGADFPVIRAYGCRNEILNSKVLYLADKREELTGLGISTLRLRFTLESAEECTEITKQYLGLEPPSLADYTRGLYYREVE